MALCDTSTPIVRPYVPKSLRKQVFQYLHDLAHPGIKASVKLVMQRFIWLGIQQDCTEWVRGCIKCQKAKITRHNQTIPGTFEKPTQRFQHIHMDIVGPLPISEGFR